MPEGLSEADGGSEKEKQQTSYPDVLKRVCGSVDFLEA